MKNLTAKQIQEVKEIKVWSYKKFHGNTKKVGSLPIENYREILAKKRNREYAKIDTCKKTNIEIVRELIKRSIESRNSNYFKVMIEGNTGIYYAHPEYAHGDYNKCRLFEKNTQTLKLMELFNSIVNKK